MRWDAEVRAAIARWAPLYGVTIEPALIHALIEKETRHGALPLEAVEPDGDHSYGPMMVKAATASTVLHISAPGTLKDPALGISYGVKYFASLLKRFAGDASRAISGYNAGPGNAVKRSNGTFPNQQYVTDVLSFWNRYKREVVAAGSVLVPLVLVGAFLLLKRARRRAA